MQNNNLKQIQKVNSIKTISIMFFLFGAILAMGWIISYLTGNPNMLNYAIFLALVTNFISYFFGDKLALSMSGAVIADQEKYSELNNIVETLAKNYGLPNPKVYIINDPASNAFATGRNKNNASVAFTTGLLATLNRSELEGVIAHELTHIKNRDMLVMTIVVVMASALSILANFAMQASFFGDKDKEGNNNTLLLVVGVLSSLLLPVAALIIQSSISRKREFMADAGAGLLTGHPEALASALIKISNFKQPLIHANTATAHLYISSPFGGVEQRQSFWQHLFMTHPPVEERVAALRGDVL